MAIGINWAEVWAPVWKAVWSTAAPAPAPAPAPRRHAGTRNYIIRGRRYFNVTPDELARLIALELIDVTREDIRVTYRDKKARPIGQVAWSSMKEAIAALNRVPRPPEVPPAPEYDESDDENSILALI